ncbi:MAG: hypothetical protein EOM72_11425 [Opitutae bacterium]|nr:hypothetical protein [Opitutae bacterium]
MKRFLLVLAMTLSMASAKSARGDDHGGSPATATSLPAGTTLSGTLEETSDVDVFKTICDPLTHYGFALFNSGNSDIDLSSAFNTWTQKLYTGAGVIGNSFVSQVETNYSIVNYADYYSGSGAKSYHVASVQIPSTPSALGDLIPFTLGTGQPLQANLFNYGATPSGKLLAISYASVDGNYNKEPALAYQSKYGSFGLYRSQGRVQLTQFDQSGSLRTLIRIPDWDDMSSEGDAMGIRVQEIPLGDIPGSEATGSIATPYEVDAWTQPVTTGVRCGVWLTNPDGLLEQWQGYELAIFGRGGTQWYPEHNTESGMISFAPREIRDAHAFTVFAREAMPTAYVIHVQSYLDDYGGWSSDTPPSGIVVPNTTKTGSIEIPPDEDGFTFAAQQGMTYAFYSPDEERFDFSMNGDWNWSGNYWSQLFTAPEAGTGTVRVAYGWGDDATTGVYQFTVSEFLDDADNDQAHAIPLVVGGPPVANDLKAPGDMDFVVFNVVSGKTYRLTGGDGLQLRIYYANTWYSRSSSSAYLDFPVNYTGPCYAVVRASPAAGAYSTSVAEASDPGDPYGDWADGIDWNGKPSGATDDADEDGFTNDEERIAGTDPTLKGDLFKATTAATTPAGDGLVLGTALAGRVYSARYTTDLMLDWSLWLPSVLSIVGDQIIAPIDPAHPNAIYRLIVELE